MGYNIVLTTAEDIVAVVDAVVAKDVGVDVSFVSEFSGIATLDQAQKALNMAKELGLVSEDSSNHTYSESSFLATKLVTAISDGMKAVYMRMIIEQYEPYRKFKERYEYTASIEMACRQIKILYSMQTNERDIKNTLISIATYANALISKGAGLYSFTEESQASCLLEISLKECALTDATLRNFLGESIYNVIDNRNVFTPLAEAVLKTKADNMDTRSVVVYAANAFESFLDGYAHSKGISLVGKNGIIQKKDALSQSLSKKHRGMIDYIGQIRNAADHGGDVDENGQMWNVSKETASVYPIIVARIIKSILLRDNGIIEV